MNIPAIFFLSQIVVITLIVVILKKILDRNLIELAIQQLETGRIKSEDSAAIVVITHKAISVDNRERIQKAIARHVPGAGALDFQIDGKLLGGMIIKAGSQVFDHSLTDRLRRAS